MRLIGFAVCHQLPSRTIELGGRYLPLCARCTGIYMGVFATYAYLLIRRGFRVNAIPKIGYSLVVAAFILPMAFDGLSSYLGIRETNNVIRLVTGALAGSALPVFAFPLLSPELILAEEKRPEEFNVFGRWYNVLIWAGFVTGAIALTLQRSLWLYWPISVFSVAGLLAIFFNIALVLVEMVGEGHTWGRRPWSFVSGALIVLATLTILNLLHKFAYDIMLDATGGVLPE